MSGSFVKLHGTILDSSIWAEPHATRIVWITMLAMADADGIVQASVSGLARRAVVTREECEGALETLMGPDPDSRDETTGERLAKVPGGWQVLNYDHYRRLLNAEDQREKHAARQRRYRERQKGVTDRHAASRTVTRAKSDYIAEAEAEADHDLVGKSDRKKRVENPSSKPPDQVRDTRAREMPGADRTRTGREQGLTHATAGIDFAKLVGGGR